MKNIFFIILFGFILSGCSSDNESTDSGNETPLNQNNQLSETDKILQNAFIAKQSDLQVAGKGEAIRLLEDDNDGSRHQRFILQLTSGQTILIAHNIDLAARIDLLKVGDTIEFYGVYEWNDKGGVVHWTHKDPQSKHIDGWLKHDGITYS